MSITRSTSVRTGRRTADVPFTRRAAGGTVPHEDDPRVTRQG
jgi:hypothetical protein